MAEFRDTAPLKPNQKQGAKIKGGKFSRLPRCLFILSVDEWEKFILNQLDMILAFSYKNGLWNYETEFWFQIIRSLLFFFSDWNGIISLRQQRLDGDRQTSLKTEAVDWTWNFDVFWKVRHFHRAKRLKVRFWNVYSVVSCCFLHTLSFYRCLVC